jgi:DMSO/TMAO reductase YedYZ molybdopterin-dependent catalytic subunit
LGKTVTENAASQGPQRGLSSESVDRRRWLRRVGAAGLAGLLPAGCARKAPEAPPATRELMRFPQKVPLIVLNDRAPCLETPWRYFRTDLTPNEAFFVRWHLQAIPTAVDLRTWRLRVRGRVTRPLELSLDDLRRLERVSVVAVNQCSGNSRSLFEPRVPGGQWGNGAMGNARWTGVRLRDLLERAGLRRDAVQVSFDGLDEGGLPSVPDYVKALNVDRARDPDVLVAYEMNGEPLPMLNGFPARLVVPGWYSTYWVKALTDIHVLDREFVGFWMAPAYRIPVSERAAQTPNLRQANETPGQLAARTEPITRMNVRSFFVRLEPGEEVRAGQPFTLDGIAFDGGDGIRTVEVSTDGGATWAQARLGPDLGRFSFRRWHSDWTPARGTHRLRVRAVTNSGEEQPAAANWNRSGYMRNVIEEMAVTAV